MKTLNFAETLIALGEGKILIDNDGYTIKILEETIMFLDNHTEHWLEIPLEQIAMPCTIKEEPVYLYEVAFKDSSGKWVFVNKPYLDKQIEENNNCNDTHNLYKTGRKFLEEEGKLVEVKE
jgi:hypothetical protein